MLTWPSTEGNCKMWTKTCYLMNRLTMHLPLTTLKTSETQRSTNSCYLHNGKDLQYAAIDFGAG